MLWLLFVFILVMLLLQDCFEPALFLALDLEVALVGSFLTSIDSSKPEELLFSWAPDDIV